MPWSAENDDGLGDRLMDGNVNYESEKRDPPAAKPLVLSLIVALGAVAFGYTLGYGNPQPCITLDKANINCTDSGADDGRLNSKEMSWFSSLVNIGCMIGALVGGLLSDKFGRTRAISIACVPFAAGYFILVWGSSVGELYVARGLAGVGTGIITVCVPVYIAEIAPPKLRGGMGSIFQLGVTVGILYAFIVGIPLGSDPTHGHGWRTMAVVGTILPCLLFVVAFFIPRSPRWLYAQDDRTEEADSTLQSLRGGPGFNIENEKRETIEALAAAEAEGSGGIMDVFTGTAGKAMVVGCGLMFAQQLSGINVVIFYSTSIFKDAGIDSATTASMIVGIIQVVMTGVTTIVIDKAGRRALLLVSLIGQISALIVLGYFFLLYPPPAANAPAGPPNPHGTIAVVAIVQYVVFFSLGLGAIPWLMMSEIFPSKVRGVASSVASVLNWTLSFVVTLLFDPLQAAISTACTYFLFAVICCVSVVFVLTMVPETKGKTLDEIEAHFAGRGTTESKDDSKRLTYITIFVAGIIAIVLCAILASGSGWY